MMVKLGFTQEGIRRKVIYNNGQYMDLILFGLTKDEFIEKQKEEGTLKSKECLIQHRRGCSLVAFATLTRTDSSIIFTKR